MPQKYKDKKEGYTYRHKRKKSGELITYIEKTIFTTRRKGIKFVHIGKDVWRIGRDTISKDKKHQVIYGPDDKNYHLWESDVDFVNTPGPNEPASYYYDVEGKKHIQEREPMNRDGCKAYESKVKIYILTHILDKKENWCFDLKNIPKVGKLKVIYANGTVKNIQFDGEFTDIFIRYSWADKKTAEEKKLGNYVEVFGYRIV